MTTTFGNVSGQFADAILPEVDGFSFGLVYNLKSVVLQVIAVGLPGDYNGDGAVNAADYTVWRDGLGTTFAQADYHVWKNNYGAVASSTARGVPEPRAICLIVAAALFRLPRKQF